MSSQLSLKINLNTKFPLNITTMNMCVLMQEVYTVQPNNRRHTMVNMLRNISGIRITVLTDFTRVIICCFMPGASPNPPMPWSDPQPTFCRNLSSWRIAIEFVKRRKASISPYNPIFIYC